MTTDLLLNKPAPDFALPLLGGNGRVVLSDLRGSIVVLHFWSAECPWSRRADLVLVYRQAKWERHNVKVVGIACNANEPESEIRYEAELRRIKYPIVLDYAQDIVITYKIQMTPHFVVLDQRGVVRYSGALDDAPTVNHLPRIIFLDLAVNALLNGESPNPATTPTYGSAIVRRMPALPDGR
jgi:peroxiredoxin